MQRAATAAEQTFSERSQRSLRQELQARKEAARLRLERQSREVHLEALRQRQKGYENAILAQGNPAHIAHDQLGPLLSEILGEERKVQIFEERAQAIESEIEELRHPSPESRAARLMALRGLGQLAGERLKKDELIDHTLEALRALLEERADLTSKMEELRAEADLESDLDGERHRELLTYLPGHMLEESQAWFARFTGTESGTLPYEVRDEVLIAGETLAHPGVYQRGETIRLREAEAAPLIRSESLRPQQAEGLEA